MLLSLWHGLNELLDHSVIVHVQRIRMLRTILKPEVMLGTSKYYFPLPNLMVASTLDFVMIQTNWHHLLDAGNINKL